MTGKARKQGISLGGLIIGTMVLLLFHSVGISSGVAANYPSKPIRIIIPSGAGGTNDQVARMVIEAMAEARLAAKALSPV